MLAQGSTPQAIVELRERIAAAARQKDRTALDALFTDDFTHTHAVGRLDSKAVRLRALLSGEPTLETVTPEEIAVRFYGTDTAVAVGRSTVGTDTYRWTAVYVRRGTSWLAAASHASRIP